MGLAAIRQLGARRVLEQRTRGHRQTVTTNTRTTTNTAQDNNNIIGIIPRIPHLGIVGNPLNSCFAGSVLHCVLAADLDLHLDPGVVLDPAQTHLFQVTKINIGCTSHLYYKVSICHYGVLEMSVMFVLHRSSDRCART